MEGVKGIVVVFAMPNGFGPDGKIDQYYDAPMLVRAVDIFEECREQQCITIFGIPRDMPKNQRGEALWSVMKEAATNAGMANIEVTWSESCDATSVVMSIAEYMKATHPNATALLVCYSPWVADHFKGCCKGAAKVHGSWNYRVIPTQWVPEPVLSRRLIYAALGILTPLAASTKRTFLAWAWLMQNLFGKRRLRGVYRGTLWTG